MRGVSSLAGALSGLVMGAAAIFLLCVAGIVVAWSTGGAASVPWIINAWPAPGGGAAGVEFVPHPTGMLVVLAVSLGLGAGLAWGRCSHA